MPKLITFAEAIKQAGERKRHILLGNGFSRACRNDLFAYDALYARAEDTLTPSTRKAFDALETTDFESVMRALKQAALLVAAYLPKDKALAKRLREDANKLRDILATVIAQNHPDRPNSIKDKEFAACRKFLRHFENIYTLNYDLLLYWALMHDHDGGPPIECNDGFRQPDDGPQDWVEWEVSGVSQNIFYLHGALHVFDAGAEIQKYTWCNTGIALVDQIRKALAADHYPIYVAEGSSESKMKRIQHSAFLSRAYRSLASIGGTLFLYGHSLAASDDHILRLIGKGKVENLFVSIYGGLDTKENKHVVARARALIDMREKSQRRNALTVHFFDAASASVWS